VLTLLSDRYAPITTVIGYLQAPLEQVANELVTWRAELGRDVNTTSVPEAFPQNLHRLEPLVAGDYPRELLVATDGEWIAYFACGAQRSDPTSRCIALTGRRGWRAATITSEPHTLGKLETPGRWGGIQLELFGPEADNPLGYVRAISAINDGGRWTFDAYGHIQHFERPEAYTARRARDRFTSTILNEYCNAIGIRPFDPDFYSGPAILLEESSIARPDDLTFHTLQQAQQLLGIQPGLADRLPG
jgi:hypothetical protein